MFSPPLQSFSHFPHGFPHHYVTLTSRKKFTISHRLIQGSSPGHTGATEILPLSLKRGCLLPEPRLKIAADFGERPNRDCRGGIRPQRLIQMGRAVPAAELIAALRQNAHKRKIHVLVKAEAVAGQMFLGAATRRETAGIRSLPYFSRICTLRWS